MFGVDVQHLCAGKLAWHEHRDAYLAVVLDGRYEELGDQGRIVAEAGTAVVHSPFERHGNEIASRGASVVNLPISVREAFHLPSLTLGDPEAVLRAVSDGAPVADALARGRCEPIGSLSEEADLLALELIAGNVPSLDEFACDQGIAQRTLRRRFSDLYGMSAAKFRARARTRRAWRDILTRKASLAAIAYDHGFADQAHMTRAVVALTGATPSIWRRTLAV